MSSLDINVWYGLHQRFGHLGHPQRWVNILGDVSGAEGELASATFSLNGLPGTKALAVGPDSRRLLAPGDFNLEIDRTLLQGGMNTVEIAALDQAGNRAVKAVTVEFFPDNTWPLPYEIDWHTTSSITDAVQIIDGQWELSAHGLHPTVIGYDRIIALGDETWVDYEVTVPLTVHNIDPAAFNEISASPGMGTFMRWTGHTDSPVVWPQPHIGWLPSGPTVWYAWREEDEELYLWRDDDTFLDKDESGLRLAFDTRYYWKMRLETKTRQGYFCGFKLWPDNVPEPAQWSLKGLYPLDSPAQGSFLFVAHHVDVSLGNITVVPC